MRKCSNTRNSFGNDRKQPLSTFSTSTDPGSNPDLDCNLLFMYNFDIKASISCITSICQNMCSQTNSLTSLKLSLNLLGIQQGKA